eukprot:1160184-Pelagomonas_calceolata.AAC.4
MVRFEKENWERAYPAIKGTCPPQASRKKAQGGTLARPLARRRKKGLLLGLSQEGARRDSG